MNDLLTELEEKLLRLALDPGAEPGEIRNSAIKLVQLWRKRKLSADDFFYIDENQGFQPPPIDYSTFVFPFGKHRTKTLAEIPRSYLSYILRWMTETDAKKFSDLIEAVGNFLKT